MPAPQECHSRPLLGHYSRPFLINLIYILISVYEVRGFGVLGFWGFGVGCQNLRLNFHGLWFGFRNLRLGF